VRTVLACAVLRGSIVLAECTGQAVPLTVTPVLETLRGELALGHEVHEFRPCSGDALIIPVRIE